MEMVHLIAFLVSTCTGILSPGNKGCSLGFEQIAVDSAVAFEGLSRSRSQVPVTRLRISSLLIVFAFALLARYAFYT